MRYALMIVVFTAGMCCAAKGTPLVNLQILGSSNGTYYSPYLAVSPGVDYDFEVVGQLAPVGTSNTHGTITSEVSGVDGIGSLSFNLTDAASNGIQIAFIYASLQGTYAQGLGPSAGTHTNSGSGTSNELQGVRPINPPGVFNGINGSPLVIEMGYFDVADEPFGSISDISGSFGGTFSSIKINDGTGVTITGPSESSADPIESIAPLNLTLNEGPEPASVAIFGVATIGLLARRRQVAA